MSTSSSAKSRNGLDGSVSAADDDNIFSAESNLTKENGELKLEIEKLKGALAFSQTELEEAYEKLQASKNNRNSNSNSSSSSNSNRNCNGNSNSSSSSNSSSNCNSNSNSNSKPASNSKSAIVN